nr:MAG TPA: hypothetical protein [Caudoviricetes sp.]
MFLSVSDISITSSHFCFLMYNTSITISTTSRMIRITLITVAFPPP